LVGNGQTLLMACVSSRRAAAMVHFRCRCNSWNEDLSTPAVAQDGRPQDGSCALLLAVHVQQLLPVSSPSGPSLWWTAK
jgi:hypothetical protein